MMEPTVTKGTPTITLTPDHIRLLRDGGMEVFTFLLDQAATAAQVSDRLQIPRAKVNFVLAKLVADGLVQVQTERIQGERVERLYRAVLPSFGMKAGEQSTLAERLEAVGVFAEQMRTGLLQAIALERRGLGMVVARARLSEERVAHYLQRLQALIQEFDAENDREDGQWYSMVLACYPASSEGV